MKDLTPYVVRESQTIMDAVAVIQGNLSRCAVVLNGSDKVVGVFSEGDVLRALLRGTNLYTPLNRVIAPSFKYLREREVETAAELVRQHGITLIPVLGEEFELADVITIAEILER